jgi:hypothetical protein
MKQLITHFSDHKMIDTDKHNYIRYRIGRLKHELWLRNRKRNDITIDEYDKFIIDNLKTGKTCIFGSAGYYLEDLVSDLTVIEQWPIVKKFYPKAQIIDDRSQIAKVNGRTFDNFVVINNRKDLWVDTKGLEKHLYHYTKAMKPGALLFYSFRDTQILFNRLTEDHSQHFKNFATQVRNNLQLNVIWEDIRFAVKQKDGAGNYDIMENPDTTNGNIKFVFEYQTKETKIKC